MDDLDFDFSLESVDWKGGNQKWQVGKNVT